MVAVPVMLTVPAIVTAAWKVAGPWNVFAPAKLCAPVVTTPRAARPASGTFRFMLAPNGAGELATVKSLPGLAERINPTVFGVMLIVVTYIGTQWAPFHPRY